MREGPTGFTLETLWRALELATEEQVTARPMTDPEFTDELIRRLNVLIEDPDAKVVVDGMIANRIIAAKSLEDHPTIRVRTDRPEYLYPTVSLTGLLNGLCGSVHGGPVDGYGLLCHVMDSDSGELLKFARTDSMEVRPAKRESS